MKNQLDTIHKIDPEFLFEQSLTANIGFSSVFIRWKCNLFI